MSYRPGPSSAAPGRRPEWIHPHSANFDADPVPGLPMESRCRGRGGEMRTTGSPAGTTTAAVASKQNMSREHEHEHEHDEVIVRGTDPAGGGAAFFAHLDALVTSTGFIVDRPTGSVHPRAGAAVYPVDYGYLAGTTGGDSEGVDVFRGSATGAGVVGVVLTADPRKRDVEVKLLLDCTDSEIEQVRRLLDEVLGIGGLLVPRR